MLAQQAEDAAAYLPSRAAFESQEQARRDFAQSVRFASPATALQDTLERLAGTDATRAVAFQQQVRRFADGLRPHIEGNLTAPRSTCGLR